MSTKGLTLIAFMVVALVVWIINLARGGDWVGLGILFFTGLIILILVGAMAFSIVRGGLRRERSHQEYHELTRALTDQTKTVIVMSRMTANATFPIHEESAGAPPALPDLPPGHLLTVGGLVIDSNAFREVDQDQSN
ncbi:MAG: hypothetical protein KJ077_10355 [Anaerolineae bacterium]|nr:hypothetical protein [Anaerolineae bacterium]